MAIDTKLKWVKPNAYRWELLKNGSDLVGCVVKLNRLHTTKGALYNCEIVVGVDSVKRAQRTSLAASKQWVMAHAVERELMRA